MNKNVEIDFSRCSPGQCGGSGHCRAVDACSKGLLEQEDPYGSPMLISTRLCSGCGSCVRTCPLGAFRIAAG